MKKTTAKKKIPSGRDNLEQIPGVGPSIAADLRGLGIREIADLKGRDPERLYLDLQSRVGAHVDRCVLYVFRCAAYFATAKRHRPELLKWWNWKDQARSRRRTSPSGR